MPQKRRVCLVLNPAAGRGAGRRLRGEIERALGARGIDYTVVETDGMGHATELAGRAAGQHADVVAAVGGDGTIHEVVNGLMALEPAVRPALALIPVGTGNDLVKVVAGTRTRSDAYDTLASGHPVRLDVGRATWTGGTEYFVNAMGTGIDVEVVRQIRGIRNLPGAAVYVLGLVRALMRYRPLRLRVTIAGDVIDRRFMLAAVANGRCVGGAFLVCPGASPDDGLLDVCMVDQLGLGRSLLVARRILRGTHGDHPAVEHRAASRVTLEAAGGEALFFQLDGELREPPGANRVDIEVLPGALTVLASAGRVTEPASDVRSTLEVR